MSCILSNSAEINPHLITGRAYLLIFALYNLFIYFLIPAVLKLVFAFKVIKLCWCSCRLEQTIHQSDTHR